VNYLEEKRSRFHHPKVSFSSFAHSLRVQPVDIRTDMSKLVKVGEVGRHQGFQIREGPRRSMGLGRRVSRRNSLRLTLNLGCSSTQFQELSHLLATRLDSTLDFGLKLVYETVSKACGIPCVAASWCERSPIQVTCVDSAKPRVRAIVANVGLRHSSIRNFTARRARHQGKFLLTWTGGANARTLRAAGGPAGDKPWRTKRPTRSVSW